MKSNVYTTVRLDIHVIVNNKLSTKKESQQITLTNNPVNVLQKAKVSLL